jgi:hypothetical protein
MIGHRTGVLLPPPLSAGGIEGLLACLGLKIVEQAKVQQRL